MGNFRVNYLKNISPIHLLWGFLCIYFITIPFFPNIAFWSMNIVVGVIIVMFVSEIIVNIFNILKNKWRLSK